MHKRIDDASALCADAFVGEKSALHKGWMDIPTLLRKMMEVVPGKQAGLAERIGLGVTQSSISRWLRGQQPEVPRYERIVELAEQLGVLSDVRSEDVAASLEKPAKRTVKIRGYVGAGGQAHRYFVDAGELGEIEAEDANDRTVALEIKGSSLGKFFDSWIVLYDDVRSPITDDLIGKLCVVGLADDRVLIKKIYRDGRWFRLVSNSDSEPDIEGVDVEWAAEVRDLRRR